MILCFHEVSETCKSKYSITPQKFRELLEKYPDAEIHFDDGFGGVFNALPILRELKRSATLFLVTDYLIGNIPERERYSEHLSIADVEKLISENIFEIGSHSVTHRSFTRLTEEEILFEINYSKKYLEKIFNVKVKKFAYPFGHTNEKIHYITQRTFEKVYTLDYNYGIKRLLVLTDADS